MCDDPLYASCKEMGFHRSPRPGPGGKKRKLLGFELLTHRRILAGEDITQSCAGGETERRCPPEYSLTLGILIRSHTLGMTLWCGSHSRPTQPQTGLDSNMPNIRVLAHCHSVAWYQKLTKSASSLPPPWVMFAGYHQRPSLTTLSKLCTICGVVKSSVFITRCIRHTSTLVRNVSRLCFRNDMSLALCIFQLLGLLGHQCPSLLYLRAFPQHELHLIPTI